MITANRLFLIPTISAFLVLIPVVGVFMWLFVIVFWYNKNNLEIHRFFKGQNYKQDELSENTLEESK